jgi:hypothetical protein
MKPQNIRPPRRSYDTFHMGRSGMDLYSNDVGADFVHIRSIAAYVGGRAQGGAAHFAPVGQQETAEVIRE